MKISRSAVLGVSLICLAALGTPAAHVSAEPLFVQDILKSPVNVSIKGIYYSSPEKGFSIDVSTDRFMKVYSDGVTIIGVKSKDTPVYYIVDENKKTVVKVSQSNLYRIGRFFDWNNMTTLVDLPGNTPVVARSKTGSDCTTYNVDKADIALCVDVNYHIPLRISQKGATVARVTSVRPLEKDLRAEADSMILSCRQKHYNFLDADSNLSPDSD